MYCVLAISQKWEIAYSVLKNARLCAKIYVQGRKRYKCVYHTCICSETSPDTYIFCNTICLCYTFMILYRFFLLDCEKRWRNATFFCCKKKYNCHRSDSYIFGTSTIVYMFFLLYIKALVGLVWVIFFYVLKKIFELDVLIDNTFKEDGV